MYAPSYRVRIAAICFLLGMLRVESLTADFILYRLPGTSLVTIFEGKTKVHPGRIVEYTHPAFGSIAINSDDALVVKAPSRQEEFRKLFQQATRTKNIEDYLEAARQALKRGLLKEFYECCSAAYKIDPKNLTLLRLIEARKLVKQPLGDSSEVVKNLREATALPTLKVEVSAHYVLLHDTGDAKVGRKRQTRAETRIELLETVYEAYFMKFAMDGVVLEPPKQHMMILLFGEEKTFLRYATVLSPELKMAAGFWSPKDNIGVFYDQGTSRMMKVLTEIAKDMQKDKQKYRGTAVSKDFAQLANSLDLLIKVAKEEADIEVVSHEATHQLAGNTGIMPRNKIGARWAHEGLASYFETPAGAGWGGIGAVNQTRLADYHIISRDPKRTPLELVVSDGLFYVATTQEEAVEAYGQAWALTYFLMETRFNKLIEYYKKSTEFDNEASPQLRIDAFTEIFGDMRRLEREFHMFMESLKSDIDRIREAGR